MDVLFAASLAAMAVAVGCAIYCCFASRAVRQTRGIGSLRAELVETQDELEKLHKLVKGLTMRDRMRDARQAKQERQQDAFPDETSQRPGESGAAWKARMRAKLVVPGRPVEHHT